MNKSFLPFPAIMEHKGYIIPKSMSTFDAFFRTLAIKEEEAEALVKIMEDLGFPLEDFQKMLEDVPSLLKVMEEYTHEEKDQIIWRKLLNRMHTMSLRLVALRDVMDLSPSEVTETLAALSRRKRRRSTSRGYNNQRGCRERG